MQRKKAARKCAFAHNALNLLNHVYDLIVHQMRKTKNFQIITFWSKTNHFKNGSVQFNQQHISKLMIFALRKSKR